MSAPVTEFALMVREDTSPTVTEKAPTVTYKGKPTTPKWCATCVGHMPHAEIRGNWICGVCGTERDA